MAYRVLVPKPVQKQLNKLPQDVRERILQKVSTLRENPRPRGCVKLRGYDREYRIRIGSYRVRYEIYDQERDVLLLHCAHRRDAYKK